MKGQRKNFTIEKHYNKQNDKVSTYSLREASQGIEKVQRGSSCLSRGFKVSRDKSPGIKPLSNTLFKNALWGDRLKYIFFLFLSRFNKYVDMNLFKITLKT